MACRGRSQPVIQETGVTLGRPPPGLFGRAPRQWGVYGAPRLGRSGWCPPPGRRKTRPQRRSPAGTSKRCPRATRSFFPSRGSGHPGWTTSWPSSWSAPAGGLRKTPVPTSPSTVICGHSCRLYGDDGGDCCPRHGTPERNRVARTGSGPTAGPPFISPHRVVVAFIGELAISDNRGIGSRGRYR